ncbi:hypothetical protein [Roseivirga sp.]|uniref:hypothetical protein n=1 Tax=Roseivirga sp. TaxID=1964215 RepID=UPI003B8C5B94
MNELLRKLKLTQSFITELEVSKSEFLQVFKASVDPGTTSHFSDTFEVFKSSKNEYKGRIGYNDFKIKKRKKLFDFNVNLAVAEGSFIEKNNTLIIETKVNGFIGAMIPFYIFVTLFYLIFLIGFPVTNPEAGFEGFLIIPFIIIHAAFMLGIPYFFMRNSTKRMVHDLERDFFYMTKNLNSYKKTN